MTLPRWPESGDVLLDPRFDLDDTASIGELFDELAERRPSACFQIWLAACCSWDALHAPEAELA